MSETGSSNLIEHLLLTHDPFGRDGTAKESPFSFYQWPACWIWPEGASAEKATVFLARLPFTLAESLAFDIHVSADQRLEMFLDGERFARGPELGDLDHWPYASYRLTLPPGAHVLEARVWYAGDWAGYAQPTRHPGFLCATPSPLAPVINTGKGNWKTRAVEGITFERPRDMWLAPPRMDQDFMAHPTPGPDEDALWQEPHLGWKGQTEGSTDTLPCWVLRPATLPPQRETPVAWGHVRHACTAQGGKPIRSSQHDGVLGQRVQGWLDGKTPFHVEPRRDIEILVDSGTYLCAWPTLPVEKGKGARISLRWAEALVELDHEGKPTGARKGNRNDLEGKTFVGRGDTWNLDGVPRILESGFWKAGRYILLQITTAEEPVSLASPSLVETGYPLDLESRLEVSDPLLQKAMPIMWRSLLACSHETYMDCPYYERMMYVGDTRLEALVTYACTRDARLPLKALRVFDESRKSHGLTSSRYPTRYRQTIPPFSLWWVAMVHDYALWRNDPGAVRSFLPGIRSVLDAFLGQIDDEGLPRLLPGWNFQDWVPGWPAGARVDGREISLMGFHLVYTLGLAARLERAFGEPEGASRFERHREKMWKALDARVWDPKQHLWADDREHGHFSEHVQCMALLGGMAEPDRSKAAVEAMIASTDLDRATIYYSHYVLETFAAYGRADALVKRLDLWRNLASQGFVTTPETPEPSRSDCHAWGAHPLYHLHASILGVRPGAYGFEKVRITPQLGGLGQARGTLAHPAGDIEISLQEERGTLHGEIVLPPGLEGVLVLGGEERPIHKTVHF